MANKEIHELITAEELSASDVIAEQRENSGTWLTRKLTFNALGLFLNKVLQFASDLNTTNKTIIGAINELAQGSGQSLDTLNDVDIDDETLADGQGIVYDATAQKWKNGAVSGGGHTYSTTEQVVGTWIDGSTVYEKSFVFTGVFYGDILIGNINTSDIEEAIDISGIMVGSDGTIKPLIFAHANSKNNYGIFITTSGDVNLRSGDGYTSTNYISKCNLTLRYTKTST